MSRAEKSSAALALAMVLVSGCAADALSPTAAEQVDALSAAASAPASCAENAWPQQLEWRGRDYGYGVATSPAGDVFVTGIRATAVDQSPSYSGSFLRKYDSCGRIVWTSQLEAGRSAVAVTANVHGHAFVTGFSAGGDGPGSAFLEKFAASGERAWSREISTQGADYARAITSDVRGNVVITGSVSGSLDGQPAVQGDDLFVTKYNGFGERLWTRVLGSIHSEAGQGVATDAKGNVYVTGYTTGAFEGYHPIGGEDLILVKYDVTGQKQWSRLIGTPYDDVANAITSDARGNIYLTGRTRGDLTVRGPTPQRPMELFVLAYDTAGNRRWSQQLDRGASDEQGTSIALDALGQVYVTGVSYVRPPSVSDPGDTDVLVVKYSSAGQLAWLRQIGSAATDFGYSIAADLSGAVYVAGATDGALPGRVHAGNSDAFVLKYSSAGDEL